MRLVAPVLLGLMVLTTQLACTRAAHEAASAPADPRSQAREQLIAHARAFAQSGDYARAEQYLLLAAKSGADPERLAPLLLDVCIKDQRYRAAIEHAELQLRRQPRAYRLRFVEATLLAAIGDVARAREELERVLQAAPQHAEAHYAIAVLLRDELGNHAQADLHFREYLKLRPGGEHAEEAAGSLLEVMP
jgi:tetratricopeptide (TPR) repeat protein